jgi:PHD/YefM family antitoxin component YafN of YafNO toxin-antitoxin module
MTKTLSMREAKARLGSLPERFDRNPETGTVIVTRNRKPVLAVMPWGLYDSIAETFDILNNEKLLRALRRSLHGARKGRTYSTAEVKKRIGI